MNRTTTTSRGIEHIGPHCTSSPSLLLLNPRDAAHALSISPRKLWELTVSGAINSVRIGRCVRYDILDLRAFIDAQKTGADDAK